MSGAEKVVTSAETLVAAGADSGIEQIVVCGRLTDVPLIRLAPGQSLRGADESAAISFRAADDGVQLSTDNSVRGIRLNASPEKRAICNDTTVPTLGRIELRGLTTTGRVQILVRDELRAGHVEVDGLNIVAATSRAARTAPTPSSPTIAAATGTAQKKQWLAEREAELLPVRYFHVVFTLPSPIADLAYHNKAVIYDLLFKASAETVLTIAADPKHLGARFCTRTWHPRISGTGDFSVR
jgi:hypothetical protein